MVFPLLSYSEPLQVGWYINVLQEESIHNMLSPSSLIQLDSQNHSYLSARFVRCVVIRRGEHGFPGCAQAVSAEVSEDSSMVMSADVASTQGANLGSQNR